MKKIFSIISFPFVWAYRFVNDAIYSLKVAIHSKRKPKGRLEARKNKEKVYDLIFYSCFLAIPFAMFILTNIIINGNAIVMAFEKMEDGKTVFAGLENFKQIFINFRIDGNYMFMLKNSLLIYLLTTVFNSFIPILFSYYVYKKLFGYKVFKVMLFIPTILSSIITVSIFTMLSNEVIPDLWLEWFDKTLHPLLVNPHSTFATIMTYTLWMGFGGGLLTQLAAMNTVDPSVSESAQLEGVGFFQELWYIVLPACYQILMLGFITGAGSIFTNSLNLYAFFGNGAPSTVSNFGYFFQIRTLDGEYAEYFYLSAWGVFTTIIATALTLSLRWLFNRFGPSEDSRENKKKV